MGRPVKDKRAVRRLLSERPTPHCSNLMLAPRALLGLEGVLVLRAIRSFAARVSPRSQLSNFPDAGVAALVTGARHADVPCTVGIVPWASAAERGMYSRLFVAAEALMLDDSSLQEPSTRRSQARNDAITRTKSYWFEPPILIPIVLAGSVFAYALYRFVYLAPGAFS
jgi:hypothetical protein